MPRAAWARRAWARSTVIREELTRGGEVPTSGKLRDELDADVPLDVRDVLGDRGLTDAEFVGGLGERPTPREGRERTQPCLQIHNQGLYQQAELCISVLSASHVASPRRGRWAQGARGVPQPPGLEGRHRWGE